ncbi:aldehyde dehydrogenase [candidate division TA06 bacterium]|nr:aldehyde dehydrogenase [candidate division TA06 bacterium]
MAKMFIAGEWMESESGQVTEIRNPATGELVDTVPKGTEKDAQKAIDAAAEAYPKWSETSPEERAKVLDKAVDLINEKKQDLAVLLTKEQGKPVSESVREIDHFLHGMKFYAGLATKVRGAQVPLPEKGVYGMVLKQSIGVCGAIVPWNFPITLMGTKVGPALIAGNTVVVKPASTTPLTTLQCVEMIHRAGLPEGVLNIVTGPGSVVGEELLRNPKVRRIAFTGETKTGKHVMEIASQGIKRVTLELGGSDPMIVCDDANMKRALTGASVGRFYNCGQACLAIKRLYLFESIADEFIEQLKGKVQRLKLGNGLNEDTRVGPLHMEFQRKEVEEQVEDAKKKGAKVLIGGERPTGDEFDKGFFYLPTLLTDVPDSGRIVQEECFGPVLPIFRVKDLDEAIEKANSSSYGLGASIWTQNLARAHQAAERLQAGNVWINSLHIGYDELPFGGIKESGIGREHGPEALEYYLEPKGVVVATG